MTFFNKKEEVIDVQLTRFGKNLLARGAWKPEYYQFFDDDIIYNIEKIGITEKQNESETRIKDGIRLRTQHTTVGLETSFDNQQKLIEAGERGKFLKLRRQADPLEKDKLLKYPLANYKRGSEQAPTFSLTSLSANITGSLSYLNPFDKGIYKNRPEITIKPKYTFIVDRTKAKELKEDEVVYDTESFVDLTKDKIEFLDGSTITREKLDLTIELEEIAASYGLDNFEIEIYEETEAGSDQYVMMLEESEIYELLNIKTDTSVKDLKDRVKKSRNFYSE